MALAYWLRPEFAFTINYGQAAFEGELRASSFACKALDIHYVVLNADCSDVGSGRMAQKASVGSAPSAEWWPYRNQFLITVGAMRAATLGISEIAIGIVRSDSIYVDGTPKFVKAVDRLLSMQEKGIRVVAPAHRYSTAELVRKSQIPFELLAIAHSCNASPLACGQCRSCLKHRESMAELGYGAF